MDESVWEKTKKSKVTMVILISFILLLIICAIISFSIYSGTSNVQSYFNNIEADSSIYNEVSNQVAINKKLSDISNNDGYTIDNAYTETNPYGISPLSGIIIFQTKNDEQIKVYINNKYVTTTDSSKKHIIPIYGLLSNYDNTVRVESSLTSQDYIFKTSEVSVDYPLTINQSSQITNDIYITVDSYTKKISGWDSEGNLRYYLDAPNSMDVEFLDNNHFLIGVPQGSNRDQYIGFVEMDYLGKIYNYYTLKNGYSFDFQILKDGTIMVPGGDIPVYFTKQMITSINPKDGSVTDSLNIYDIVKNIDPDFADKYLGPSAIRNGFYYDEDSHNLVVSFRNINTIWCFDYQNKTLKWVLTDPSNPLFKNDVWKDYLVTVDTGRYPLGQHSPQLIDGNLFYFNNGIDRYKLNELNEDDTVTNYKNNYSDVELLHIDETTHQATTLYTYDSDKKYLSIKYGYSRILDNNHKLIDYGYILKDSYRNSKNSLKESEKGVDNIYSKIIELDSDDNIVFEATSEEGKYRVFKHSLYNETTENIDINKLNIFNTISSDSLTESNYKKIDINDSIEWINSLEFTKNTFTTDYNFKEDDSIKLYFMNKAGKIYILNYKDSSNSTINRIFNVSLPSGYYALFIDVNGTLYKTNKVYKW